MRLTASSDVGWARTSRRLERRMVPRSKAPGQADCRKCRGARLPGVGGRALDRAVRVEAGGPGREVGHAQRPRAVVVGAADVALAVEIGDQQSEIAEPDAAAAVEVE